ncbi:MAG: type II toxin-antitoxin system HicB family antitoxin [Actinomycetota bacterium]|nr:type II toxin-antitoxin system HicB family antitoxin [Actinomycetota bacterium]
MATFTLERRTALLKARVHPVLHRRAKIRATAQGKSMQQYVEDLVKEDLGDEKSGREAPSYLDGDLAEEVIADAILRRAARELTKLAGRSSDPVDASAPGTISARSVGALVERETALRCATESDAHTRAEKEIRAAPEVAEKAKK